MTCIVGLAEGGSVWIGGDAATVCGDQITRIKTPKVFRKPIDSNGNAIILGSAGSGRINQLALYALRLPDTDLSLYEPMEYLVNRFVPTLRACLSENGHIGECESADAAPGNSAMLIGFQGRLFLMCSNFYIYESEFGFDTVGSGCEVAAGAMHATQGQEPERRVRAALGAAADLIKSVCAPFYIEKP